MDRNGHQFVDQLALATWTSHNLCPLRLFAARCGTLQ